MTDVVRCLTNVAGEGLEDSLGVKAGLAFLALSTSKTSSTRLPISPYPPLAIAPPPPTLLKAHHNNGIAPTETVRHYGDIATSNPQFTANPLHPRLPRHATEATSAFLPPSKAHGINFAKCIKVPTSFPKGLPASCIQSGCSG